MVNMVFTTKNLTSTVYPNVGFRTAVNNHSYDVRCAPFLTSIHVGASPLHPTFPLGTLPEKDKPAPVH